jgi:aryl-alcohol dehydrogenase-like predicted oxidoreductase
MDGARPAGARLTLFHQFVRYNGPLADTASTAYVNLARRHGLSPAQMALAFVNRQPFVTSNIIGATTMEQLREDISSVQVSLTTEILSEIDAIHRNYSNPCP